MEQLQHMLVIVQSVSIRLHICYLFCWLLLEAGGCASWLWAKQRSLQLATENLSHSYLHCNWLETQAMLHAWQENHCWTSSRTHNQSSSVTEMMQFCQLVNHGQYFSHFLCVTKKKKKMHWRVWRSWPTCKTVTSLPTSTVLNLTTLRNRT